MSYVKRLLGRLAGDERGGEVIEYALVAGMIVIAAVVLIASVGTKVVARWNVVDGGDL